MRKICFKEGKKFFVTTVGRNEVVTPVSVPDVMALVMEEVIKELVEAPDCADSLQPVLSVFVDEEVYTPLVLEPNKAWILPCTVELFLLLSITRLPLWSQLIPFKILLTGWRL